MICQACEAAGFEQCHGPHILDETIKALAQSKPTPRDRRLLMLYGITEAEYQKILEYQEGVCFICKREPVTFRLSVDHRHADGLTRGLLCWDCNRAVTLLRESLDRASNLYEYLRRPPAETALGHRVIGRPGRSTRKWRTKAERRDRMAWVKERIREIWPSAK